MTVAFLQLLDLKDLGTACYSVRRVHFSLSLSSSSNHLRHTQSSINIKNSCQILARSPFVHPEQLWLGVDFTRPRKALCVIWDRGVSGRSSPVSWKAEPSRVYTCFSSAYHICSVILKPGEYMGQASTL